MTENALLQMQMPASAILDNAAPHVSMHGKLCRYITIAILSFACV